MGFCIALMYSFMGCDVFIYVLICVLFRVLIPFLFKIYNLLFAAL